MDAQTQLVAELYKTLNDAQKQEVCNMIDTLLSQQLNDQKGGAQPLLFGLSSPRF